MMAMSKAEPSTVDGRQLILASASPRRAAILRAAGYRFEVASSGVNELLDPLSEPSQIAMYVANVKAMSVLERVTGSVVIGADTIVVVGRRMLGKPATAEDARSMLRMLCGRRHQVITGVCVASERAVSTGFQTTEVLFRSYASHEIEEYLSTGLPFDRAGAYGIQDEPFSPVVSFEWCYLNVVGLPMCVAGGLLTEIGIDPLDGRVECAGHAASRIESSR